MKRRKGGWVKGRQSEEETSVLKSAINLNMHNVALY